MAVLRILKYGNPLLRMKSELIVTIDESIHELVNDMMETMHVHEGIGLAAPQVAQLITLFVIDMSLIEQDGQPMAVINPEILEKNGQTSIDEGCLCIPDIRGEVKRPEQIRVKYMDIDGNVHVKELNEITARVFQHEIDHLNGVLFVDRLGTMKRKLLQKQLKTIAEKEMSLIND